MKTLLSRVAALNPYLGEGSLAVGRVLQSVSDHVVSNSVLAVVCPALLVGDGRHVHLLENVSQGTRGGQSPPASHHGAHPLVVLSGLREADWLNNYTGKVVTI